MHKKNLETRQEKYPGMVSASIALLLCIGVLIGGILIFNVDTAVALLAATVVLIFYGMKNGIKYAELQDCMTKNIAEAANILIYIALIGALVGSFMAAGTIPYIICLGLKLISPLIFLPLTVIMCGVVSMCTGSGMSSTFTVGVAFMGIAEGMGISPVMTAGAVACGAYLGDKQSPVSGFAAFVSGISRVELMKHCKDMAYTTFPALLGTLAIFFVLGMRYRSLDISTENIDRIIDGFEGVFNFSVITLIPLAVIMLLIMAKVPSMPAIALGIIAAVAVAIAYQQDSAVYVLDVLMNGYDLKAGPEFVAEIVNRGGMISMASTLIVIMMALCMGGVLDRTHIMEVVAGKLASRISNTRSLIVSTVFLTIFSHYATSHSLSASVLTVNALEKKYEELGLDKSMMSRSISDGAVTLSPVVPWCPDAIVCAQALGVATLTYAPYYFMIYLTVIMAVVCACTGIGIKYNNTEVCHGEKKRMD